MLFLVRASTVTESFKHANGKYVYHCSECAKGIIQVGIKRIVIMADDIPEKWSESFKVTKEMFDEIGIKVEFLYGDI